MRRVTGSIDRWIKALIVMNILVVAGLATVLGLDTLRGTPPGHPAQAAASAAASGSPELMAMGLAHIPTSNSCTLCHDPGQAVLKPVPAIGHPLEGWRNCVVCHTDAKLGRTAPGHDGIAETECLNCHKVAVDGPAITQPHSKLQDQKCLDCHGSYAHLPTSMVGRRQDECWLCHKPTALAPPEYPHPRDNPLSCRACHQSPEVGNLPIDHALRADTTCLLCHDIKQVAVAEGAASPVPASSGAPGGSPEGSPTAAPGSPSPDPGAAVPGPDGAFRWRLLVP